MAIKQYMQELGQQARLTGSLCEQRRSHRRPEGRPERQGR
jgi:hypothetical protein